MGKTIYLKLDTEYGIITIPFIGISEVDDFTVRYDNLKELVMALIKVLKLKLDLYDVECAYLTYEKYKRGFDSSCLNIKYRSDNFNTDSLVNAFCEYLTKDPKRIWKSDIRYVKTGGMISFMNTGRISRFEIKNAVNAYLHEERGYKRKRDIYFYLKEQFGTNFNIKIDKVDEVIVTRSKELSVYDLEDDSYLSHLIELYRRGDYQFEEAMEQIAQADLHELSRLLKNGSYGIVDGVSHYDETLAKDIKMIENCTGITIENLRTNYVSFGRKKGSRR